MSFVDKIRENDAELADLRLTEEVQAYAMDVAELANALKANTVVSFIRLDRDFLPSMTPEDIVVFFEAIGQLPNLKEASIWHASAPVRVIADFIKASQGLEKLHLGCIDLTGAEEDFKSINETLKGHPNLTSFNLTDFSLNDDSVKIDGLIETLGSLPKLTSVKLEATHAKRSSLVGSVAAAKQVKITVGGAALATLINSKTLEELTLSRLVLSDDDFRQVADAVKTSPALTGLHLPHCQINDDTCSRLAVAIGESTKLEEVDLSCNKITDEGCIAIATVLKQNTSVKYLRLWGNVKISNAGFDALVDMMESNCVLERVPLMMPMAAKAKIDARLVQNRSSTNQAA